jgi:hypothetical protein
MADEFPDTVNGYRSDLFGLGFRSLFEPACVTGNQRLDRIHPVHVRGHRHNGERATAEPGSHCVGSIVGNDHHRSRLVRFAGQPRPEVNDANLPTKP